MAIVKKSSGDGDSKYLNPGFYSKPENQFWNKSHQVSVDQNGSVDTVYATNNKGREYFNECLDRTELRERQYRAHNLQMR